MDNNNNVNVTKILACGRGKVKSLGSPRELKKYLSII